MKRHHFQQGIALTGIVFSLLFLFPEEHKANSFPTVTSATLATSSGGTHSEINLVENGTRTVYIWGSASDADGCEDVTTIGQMTAQFWRGNTGPNCGNDGNYCYQATAEQCSFSGCTGFGDVDFDYECSFEVQYYADSTTEGPYAGDVWNGRAVAQDGFLAQGVATDTIEMNSLMGMSVGDLDYGAIDLGTTSSPTPLEIRNTGNTGVDMDIRANGDLNCSSNGSIPLDNARYDFNQNVTWDNATALTTTDVELEMDLDPRTNELENTPENLYFQLKVPEVGIGGVCANNITTTVKADAEGGW